MKIDLSYFLNKKRISLEKFCKLNNLTNYDLLLEYCRKNNFICVEQKEFDAFNLKVSEAKKETESSKSEKNEKSTTKTRRRGRKPKAQKSGNANKKSDTQ